VTITCKLEGHKNRAFFHFRLLLYLLFCKLHWFFTSCESE